jgi:hypothetical protein
MKTSQKADPSLRFTVRNQFFEDHQMGPSFHRGKHWNWQSPNCLIDRFAELFEDHPVLFIVEQWRFNIWRKATFSWANNER